MSDHKKASPKDLGKGLAERAARLSIRNNKRTKKANAKAIAAFNAALGIKKKR